MKKITSLFFLIATLAFVACDDDPSLDPDKVFPNTPVERNELDQWLLENYTNTYNIQVNYRYEDKETDMKYDIVPADYNKSVALAIMLKHVWLDAYTELMGGGEKGQEFIKATSPRLIQFIGSMAFNTNGTAVLGFAEGGLMITFNNVNGIDPQKPDLTMLNSNFFHVMHHEYAHILHQTKDYPTTFNTVTPSDYLPTAWDKVSDKEALTLGFITAYAMAEPAEDFVETYSIYITNTPEYWQAQMEAAGTEGAALIQQKLDIVRSYMHDSWNIDIDKMRDIVVKRYNDIPEMDLTTLK